MFIHFQEHKKAKYGLLSDRQKVSQPEVQDPRDVTLEI